MPTEGSISIAPGRKHQALGLSTEDLLQMYSQMLLTRALDQRAWLLNRQGKVGIVGPCQGHEACGIGAAWALDPRRDLFFPYYRDLGLVIGLGVSAQEVMLGYLAKAGEPFSGARQFTLHGAYPKYRIYNTSNVVSANTLKAVGAALAAKIKREPVVTLACFGDGGSSEGEVHEAMNFAGVHRLPVIFLCQNNRYAISVPQSRQMAIENVADRAAGYGFPGVVIDGADVLEVYRAIKEAAERARSGDGPTLVEAKVERLGPHTSDDDDRRYRPREELEEARRRADPLTRFRAYLTGSGLLSEEQDRAYQRRVQQEVDEATEFADKAPYPDPSTLLDHVYGDAAQKGA